VILQLQFAYSQNIKKAEYFFDNEPGIGMATPIAGFIADSTAGYTFTANIGNLTPGGYHYIYVRVMDSLGNWSVVSSQYFLVNPLGATPVITNVTFRLAQAEYFIDADPGTGHGIPMFIFAGDSINQAYTVNIASLSAGNHIIGFRVKDVGQNWSVVGTKSFLIKTTACSPPNALFSSDIVNAGSVTHLTNLSTNTNVGTTYLWKISKPPDSVMATTLNMSYTFASPGYYDVSLKAYNTDTCTSFWKQKVLVGPVLSKAITITGNTVFCDGDSVLLLAPNGSNFQWSTGATTQQITVKTSGNFQVTYIDLNGNGAVSNIVSVLVNPVLSLTVTVSPANNGLSNGSALATVSGGSGYIYTYNWSTTQTTPVVQGLLPEPIL